jgi:UDP-2-acetamido-3-amino-2,3-dideoxy-glucuronate N-acetyltransferase
VVNPRSEVARKDEYKATLVKRGASIGANATIVCGVTIGEYAFIGAGAVVREDVAPRALMVGVPARQIGWICDCGERLQDGQARAECGACGRVFEVSSAGAEPVTG